MMVLARKVSNAATAASALVAVVAMASCGSATSPSPSPAPPSSQATSRLNLRAGPQFLSFLAFALTSEFEPAQCTPLKVPAGGTAVTTRVMLEQSGSEWIARTSPPSAGTLEVRLRASGVSALEGEVVEGTVRGFAIDLGQEPRAPVDVTMRIGGQSGTAVLGGYVERSVLFATGRIDGAISFSDSRNATATCTAAQWLMQPVAGILGSATIAAPLLAAPGPP